MRARAAVLALLALTACPRLDPMQRQQKYKAYQSSEYYADGLAMRDPPAGTVPSGGARIASPSAVASLDW